MLQHVQNGVTTEQEGICEHEREVLELTKHHGESLALECAPCPEM